jgi:hypothetical protein
MDYAIEHTVLDQTVRLAVTISGPGTIRETARQAIEQIMGRECERFAQIAGVDVRDQQEEATRQRPPQERGHTVLMAGIKAPEARIVVREGEP